MQRRTFLKKSAIGIGTLAGFYGGVLKAEEAASDRQHDEAQHLNELNFGGMEEESGLAWGTNAVVLKSPWNMAPTVSDLLEDSEHTIALHQFYCVGGEDRPATPTECRLAYNSDELFVVFRCGELNMSFPYANLNTNWPAADWHSLHGLPSAANNWPPNPDEVDFLVQPDTAIPSYYHFAATLQGLSFGCQRLMNSKAEITADAAAVARDSSVIVNKVEGFEAAVTKKADDWIVFFQIPWQIMGGKPGSRFGLLPMRTRWRDGEFSSPVALDFNEGMPIDVLIEICFSGAAHVQGSQSSLCQLPSGTFRWQRPAVLSYPDLDTCQRIWQMESSLAAPTDKTNLAQRLYLTQRWMDLMTQEGFTPLPQSWGLIADDLTLAYVRQRVNATFQKGELKEACHLLDVYLGQIDGMSRWWYADGSPGNILKDAWTPVTTVTSLKVQENTMLMCCKAGSHDIQLSLALPAAGGIRIYGSDQGYWRPDGLLPLEATNTSGSWSINVSDGKIVINENPFSVTLYDASGKVATQIGARNLAFRFGEDGKILAGDFRNQLDFDEVIFGFGEKYDRFNHNRNVLTLWGSDDWVGNGEGLANTTYKPLPIFHSSKGYLVFVNSSYRLRADIGKTNPNEYRITQHGPVFDYYFFLGTPEKTLQSYTALTGRPPLPPKWAFEPWMGRGGEAWASGELHNAEAEEESVAKRFAELDIPHSAIYAEGPSALSPALNQFMSARGIRVLGYFMPKVGYSRQESLMPELSHDQIPILHCGSENQTRALGYIDFTNPNAPELCRRALREALDLGEAGSMVDYGDLVPDDARFDDGQHGSEMHNFYYYDYQRTVSEAFREKRGDDFILYGRGAAPGTQRWVGQFAGDHPANFSGLRHVLTGALNLCACGYSNWGSDLGGYFGFPQPAVYMRWFQFGCFSPLMRPHGTAPREPWYFGESAVTNYKFLAWTRENILNYIFNAAAIAHRTGMSIMRSMPASFPHELQMAPVADQYMFGPDLLVAPVLNEDTFRTIVFPSGVWTSLWDGGTVHGPATIKVRAPLDFIPVYLRPGAVVPVQLSRELQFGKSMTNGRVDAMVVTRPSGNARVSLLNAWGEAGRATGRSEAGGLSWTIENLPEMGYLLVYGTTAVSNVRVNGETVPKVALESASLQVGWATDPTFNRLVVRLPSHRIEHNQFRTEVEAELSSREN